MNNQEAIANLNMISVAFVEPVTKEQRKLINDTFDEAIKALVELPKRRKEVKRWRAKAHQIQCDKCEVGNPCLYCKHEFEPKIGHWKRISIDKYSEHAMYWYRCDRCGKDNLGNTDWCPNCGCRMIETQESEDKE